MAAVVLHQFPFSHFNDKARWALAHKAVDHERRSYLPGPHLPALRRLSGQPQTPVLVYDGTVVPGSAAIIAFLEQMVPRAPLYPADPVQRAAALDWQSRLDAAFGPAVRTALFSVLIEEPDYLCGMFASGKGAVKRALYRLGFPLAKPLMAKGNGVDSTAGIAAAFSLVERTLDEIASAVAGSGYLVGERFSVADLAAAALVAPLCDPPVPDMQRPRPRPAAFAAFLDRYAEHPACVWAESMYLRHRPPGHDLRNGGPAPSGVSAPGQ